MAILHHYPFCPHSRFARLALAETGIEPELREERPWERRTEFLAINPAGVTPVLMNGQGFFVPGATVIAEYLDETCGGGLGEARLLPEQPAARVEVRRLLDWFLTKFDDEVTSYLVTEKIYKRFMDAEAGGGPPDTGVIRAARTNMRYHLHYIGYLLTGRTWLAGDAMTYADLAAAAHLSCADYLGDVPWNESETAKGWYARVKARPAFRALLADRVPGIAPADHYATIEG
jgi:glutathione S-transferase